MDNHYEQEIWARVVEIERTHGENAAAHIAERIAAFEAIADADAVTFWRDLEDRLAKLRKIGGQG